MHLVTLQSPFPSPSVLCRQLPFFLLSLHWIWQIFFTNLLVLKTWLILFWTIGFTVFNTLFSGRKCNSSPELQWYGPWLPSSQVKSRPVHVTIVPPTTNRHILNSVSSSIVQGEPFKDTSASAVAPRDVELRPVSFVPRTLLKLSSMSGIPGRASGWPWPHQNSRLADQWTAVSRVLQYPSLV